MCGDDEGSSLDFRILLSKHGLGHLQDSEDCALEEQDEPRPEVRLPVMTQAAMHQVCTGSLLLKESRPSTA